VVGREGRLSFKDPEGRGKVGKITLFDTSKVLAKNQMMVPLLPFFPPPWKRCGEKEWLVLACPEEESCLLFLIIKRKEKKNLFLF